VRWHWEKAGTIEHYGVNRRLASRNSLKSLDLSEAA